MGRHVKVTLEDRQYLEKRIKEGISINNIAKEMNRSPSTLHRDLKRCKKKYNAKEAHDNTCHGFQKTDFDIIGKKFGMLKIIMYAGITNHRTWWRAKCDCGNETRISRKVIYDNRSKKIPLNCGCMGKQKSYQKKDENELNLLSRYNLLKKLVEEVDGCWIWKGYINKISRVPMTSFNGKVRSVRRMFYEILHPEENEDAQWVYANCGDRTCVNPDHIVAGRPPKGCYYN